jgi:hypothetical protein
MGFAALVMLVGLVFGMISIKLMSVVENAQIVVVRGKRISNDLGRSTVVPTRVIVAFAMGARKLIILRIGIWFFTRLSTIVFTVEGMYPEKFVEGAALKMMKTVMISNRIRAATVKQGKHVARKIKVRGISKTPDYP